MAADSRRRRERARVLAAQGVWPVWFGRVRFLSFCERGGAATDRAVRERSGLRESNNISCMSRARIVGWAVA